MKKEALPSWRAVPPPEQAEGLERFLSPEPRSRILDLGCGAGRLTVELARRGHRVLGVDDDEAALSAARASAKNERLNMHFVKSDPRLITYRAEFDAVVCVDNAFGRLPSDRDDLKALEAARKGLKPGARLIIDQVNREWLLRHFEPHHWEAGQGGPSAVVLDRMTFDFEKGRLDNHRTLVGSDGKRTPAFVSLRLYTLTELKAQLERAGFEYRQSWGGFDGSAYGMDSPRLIVMAVAPAPAAARKREQLPGAALRIKGRRR